jgi:5-methylcytosine-specific restriction endonuclease McrA
MRTAIAADEVRALLGVVENYWRACRAGVPPRANPLDELDDKLLRRVLYLGDRPAYDAYLRSQRWRDFRALALELANYTCEHCGASERTNRLLVLDVHHKTYTRLGRERTSDVDVLCRPCHRKADERRRRASRRAR